ncbi:MAG: hypothetical protein NTX61_18800 [Bacteroidetes bacterium]|nr:hypothetical protein [Bacteroidota bacterium]
MATKKIDLEVDFIGGQEALTETEEKALYEYFTSKRSSFMRPPSEKRHKSSKKPKVTV